MHASVQTLGKPMLSETRLKQGNIEKMMLQLEENKNGYVWVDLEVIHCVSSGLEEVLRTITCISNNSTSPSVSAELARKRVCYYSLLVE